MGLQQLQKKLQQEVDQLKLKVTDATNKYNILPNAILKVERGEEERGEERRERGGERGREGEREGGGEGEERIRLLIEFAATATREAARGDGTACSEGEGVGDGG